MNILGIDTSSKFLCLAVSKNQKILANTRKKLGRKHLALLIPSVEAILKKSGIPKTKIDIVGIGLGPGSFTGLRISLSLVKALAFALGKKISAIPSLDVIAKNARVDGDISVILDARRGNVYTAFYRNKAEALKRTSAYLLLDFNTWLSRINKKTYVLGDGLSVYGQSIRLNPNITVMPDKFCYPDAKSLNLLVYEKIKKSGPDDLDKVFPLYLYPKECQIKKA